ncbi:MAG TPA: hypothetical protein VMV73_06855, partial [Candidatus Dormibacteraeota bacterium]|nr:hypothetical protein [Candidatus Dormibacteraeota bacterium]
ESSGTTSGSAGRQYVENPALYDAALLAGFDRFMLPDGAALRYLLLVPNPAQHPRSSLGYMMGKVAATRGDAETGWYVNDDTLLVDAFVADCSDTVERRQSVCIAATALALLHVVEALEARNLTFTLAPGSRVMETGGFKGRRERVERDELYARTCARFGIEPEAILAEYGMSELCSQYYDDLSASRDGLPSGARIKRSPPWLRTRVLDERGIDCAEGSVGVLAHIDLANRSSCIAVLTEDLGAHIGDGIVLLGRERGAQLRGCSLDAEGLRAI